MDSGLTGAPAKVAPAGLPAPVPPASPARPQTLSSLLVQLVRQSRGPITVKRLAEKVEARSFPTRSQSVSKAVKTAAEKLVARGAFQRPVGQPGAMMAEPKGNTYLLATNS